MSGIAEAFSKLPIMVRAFLIIGALVSFGFTVGASTTGMLAVPAQVDANAAKIEMQDSVLMIHDRALMEHERRMNSVDERLDRTACLMTAQASGGSVFQCR